MKKILLVDDDRELCDEIRELLSSENYDIATAYDGLNAEQLIRKNDYALLILDLKIPGMNGFELLKIAKKKNKNSKIIILTGSPMLLETNRIPGKILTHNEEEKKRLNLADKIINKPFEAEDFINNIKSFIEKT